MQRMLTAIITPLVLAACSSGEGTSGSGGGVAGVNAGATGLSIFATLAAESFSSDARESDCDEDEEGIIEQRISSDLGTASITVRDTSLVTTNANKGVLFNSYTVSYRGISGGAPALANRVQGESVPIFLGNADTASAEVPVVLVELDTTKAEFRLKNPHS
ncbi:MAG: hypothetical protein M5U09_25845 [Gammaproteobacteria bacterium]|nr:hypothetical protein [Gammaproteobacteria bacterium]